MSDPRRLVALTAVLGLAVTLASALCAQAAIYRTGQTIRGAGQAGVELLRNGILLDTIDGSFGWQTVRGGLVYRDAHDAMLRFTTDRGTPQRVARLVPAYRDDDALPAVIDSTIAFWSYAPDPGGGFHVRAVRHDFDTGRTDTTNLFSDYLDAANPARYERPARDGDYVIYRVDGAAVWLDSRWRIVRRRGRD